MLLGSGLIPVIAATEARGAGTPVAPQVSGTGIAELAAGGYATLELEPDPFQRGAPRALAGSGPAQSLHVAVVLVAFDGEPAPLFSAGDVEATLFSATGSVADLYREQSFGLIQLSGAVFGWTSVPRGEQGCDFVGWAESAQAAVGEDAVNAFTNLLVVFPQTQACEWTGLAYVGGSTAWLNGEPSTRAAAHEIGHNIGLGHAGSLTCTGAKGRVALSASCTKESEYGDPFTLMGSGGTLHVNAVHKTQLGWLRPENIVDVAASGTYELEPLGRSSSGTQVIRVPRGDSTLFVEYRRPIAAFERFGGPFEPAAGVTVRVARGSPGALESLLVDAHPATNSYADAVLGQGEGLVDTSSGIRVHTRSAAAERALVEVVIPGTDAAPRVKLSPAAPTTLVAVKTPGPRRSRVDLSWLPVGAAGTLAHYLVLRNGQVVARTKRPRSTRFEKHGRRAVYRVVAVGENGARGGKSPRLVIRTARPSSRARLRSPIRGVRSRPTSNGRLAIGLTTALDASVRDEARNVVERLPRSGSLALQLATGRARFLVRPVDRPAARAVQVIAVRRSSPSG